MDKLALLPRFDPIKIDPRPMPRRKDSAPRTSLAFGHMDTLGS